MTSLAETLRELPALRWLLGYVLLARGLAYLATGRLYRALNDLGWVARGSGAYPANVFARALVLREARRAARGDNPIRRSYLEDAESAALAASYSLNGGPHELLRDLIVLKSATATEKGVILLKYGRTFNAVIAMLDLQALMRRYIFVLEPCWAGYCGPDLLMWLEPGHPVYVMCFTDDDHRFVADAGAPLVPLRLGPADWVNADLFAPQAGAPREYDIVMVANWAVHKRHAVLFDALRRIRDRSLRVLLIGFPWGGRTADDIRREAAGIDSGRITIELLEKLPSTEVARRLAQCRLFVFLSRKEGDNKALVEAMFSDVPAVVYDRTIGGAVNRINAATGRLSSEADLAATIEDMLDHHDRFSPRAWALTHTGSAVATRVLDAAIRDGVSRAGGAYGDGIVEKTNSPNLAYKQPEQRARFARDYDAILATRRDGSAPRASAVA